ncbi:general stress protein [Corticicoccus populi]|uniref:General stress protein n=1 Tax=Corticicoccus populi TaxID=1812821 RepID=A0ABW5WWF7_9STAP
MAPFIKEYNNDEEIQEAIQTLKSNNIEQENIYVICHDDDRTKRIVDNASANTIGLSEQGLADAVKTTFEKQGDELRNKLQNVGFSTEEASKYEAEMDKGAVFLIVTDVEGDAEKVNIETLLNE